MDQWCKLTEPKLAGFAFDTGHAVRAGKYPAAIIATLGKRPGVIHFADASEQVASVTKRPPLGEGRMKIPAVIEALRKAGYNQWLGNVPELGGYGWTVWTRRKRIRTRPSSRKRFFQYSAHSRGSVIRRNGILALCAAPASVQPNPIFFSRRPSSRISRSK